jgi:hypothetical protein
MADVPLKAADQVARGPPSLVGRMSLLLVSATGFIGVAMAGGGSRGGVIPKRFSCRPGRSPDDGIG